MIRRIYSKLILLSHPGLGDFMLSVRFPPPPPPRPPRLPQRLLPLTPKTFVPNLTYLGQRIYRFGEMYWMTFLWPWRSWLWYWFTKIHLSARWNKNLSSNHYITWLIASSPLVMLITWLDFGEILLETFWRIFFKNFGCVFSRWNTPLVISQEWLVRLMWNEKKVHRLDSGYTMWPWSLTSHTTLTLNFSRSHFEIAVSQDVEWIGRELIRYWADCMAFPSTLTLTLQSVNSLISEMAWPIDMEQKGCSLPWYWLCLTMVGCSPGARRITSRVQKVWIVGCASGPLEITQRWFLSFPLRAFGLGVHPKWPPKMV